MKNKRVTNEVGTDNMGRVIFLSTIAAIGGFLFGFDSGVINGTVGALQEAFNSDAVGTGFNVASMLLGCALGAFFGGSLADKFGRKPILLITAVAFIFSAWGSGAAGSSFSFVIARILGGFAVGAASVLVPAYISEIAPPKVRGALTTLMQLMIVIGLFLAFVSNYNIAGSAVSGAADVRHITTIGEAIGSYYGYEVVGIFQSQEEIDNAPVDTQGENPTPGDFQFRDVNGDGVIDEDDRTILGSYHPDFTWGISNRFNWKNIDFSFFIQGVEGREILNLTARHLKNGEANFGSYAVLNDRWRSPENPGNGEAETALRSVVQSNQYELIPDYADIWGVENANNQESIFEIQYKSGGQGTGSPFTEYYSPDLSISGGVGGGNAPQAIPDELLTIYDASDSRLSDAFGTTEEAGDPYLSKYDGTQFAAFDGDNNFIVFRYADVLLMLAEAIGEGQEAIDLIDEVRERAGLTTSVADLPGTFSEKLLAERQREFVGENKRWPDLLRFGVAPQVMADFLSDEGFTASDVRLLYPILQRELDAAPDQLTQNTL